jgi:hypothetical protein
MHVLLARQWRDAADRLDRRLAGLSDAECFWEPVPDSWTVRPDESAPSGWNIDYDWPPPDPAPLTTIAWRLVHLANGNWIYWEHAFGPGKRMFPDLEVPGSAEAAIAYWRDSRAPITAWLDAAPSADELAAPRPSHLGEPRSAAEVLAILIDEQTHHGAEIALLRDLYLRLPRDDREASRA